MFYVRIIDENGLLVRDDFVDELTDRTIETPCSSGFYRPKWDGAQWIEGGTAPEAAEPAPTLEERVAATEAALLEIILGGAV